jgi:Ca2+-binding EF-hand superfamily protein
MADVPPAAAPPPSAAEVAASQAAALAKLEEAERTMAEIDATEAHLAKVDNTNEFASAQQLLEYMDKHKLKAMDFYKMMDKDGSEGVTIDEIGLLLHNIGATHDVGEFDEDTIDELFHLLDVDGDGELTFQEFVGRVREAELARRKDVEGMKRRELGEFEAEEQRGKLLSAEEMQEQLRKLHTENTALKQKLGQVSKALLKATADAAQTEAKWSGGAAGHGVVKVSQAERKLRQVQLKINELHVMNENLHHKTDSVVLTQRCQQLEEAIVQAAAEKKRLVEANAALQVDLGRNDKKALLEHEGRGEAALFDRDYRSTARENSALHRNLKEAEDKERQMMELSRKQDLKISHLQEDIDNCDRDYEVVVALRKGKKEQEKLKARQKKLDADLKTLKNSEKTEAKKLKRERTKEDEEIARLTKDVAKLMKQLDAAGLDLETIGPDGTNVHIS